MRRLWLVLGCAFCSLELVYLAIARLGDLRQHAAAFLWYAGAAVLIYLGVVWVLRRTRLPALPASRKLVGGIVLGGVAFRLTLLGLTPTLSDDVYRYLWDGRVQAAGINPYRYAPDDAALQGLRTEAWASINHPHIPTIYPPLMQLAFRTGVRLAPTIHMQKVIFLICDVLVTLLLVGWLPRWGIHPLASLIYTWHPLVVVETAAGGHNDPWGVLWLLIGLWLWHGRRRVTAAASLAMAFLAKMSTALLLPFFAVRARKPLAVFLGVIALGGASCLCSPHFTPGLRPYAQDWEFNSSLFSLLLLALRDPVVTRVVCGIVAVLIGVWMARRTEDLFAYTCVMLQTVILLFPVVEPWYLLWLIPLLCVRFSWAWLGFTGLVLLSYTVLVGYVHDGVWQIPGWVKWVEYGPLYLWLLWRGWQKLADVSHKAVSNQQPAVSS